MSLPSNPYIAGEPVGRTPAFVGREDVLREVLHILRHPVHNAITLFGQRRIGKTSILQWLEVHLPAQGPYVPVYFDLMGWTDRPLRAVLQGLAEAVARVLGRTPPQLGAEAPRVFREIWLPEALATLEPGQSLVLLMDEFDVLADPEADRNIKRTFFTYMRDLRTLDPQRLQFVFVLGRSLHDLDIVAQGLFKDLPHRRVSLLSPEATRQLVRLSERDGSLTWTDAAVERVWEWTHGHPYLTQALCAEVWDSAYDESDAPPPVTPQAVDAAVPGTLTRSEHMFVWLWEGLGPAEKVVAAALAQAGPGVVSEAQLQRILAESGVRILIRELQDAPRMLQAWDILAPAEGGYRFQVELLRRWIAENKPLARTQDELDRLNPAADNLYQAARGLYESGDWQRARDVLQEALALNPSHMGALELAGEICLAQGDLDRAQQHLERLAELAPGRARHRLKQIYLQRAEQAATPQERLAWLERILALLPDDPDARAAYEALQQQMEEEAQLSVRFAQGREALAQRQWQRAIEALQWVVARRADYAEDGQWAAALLARAVQAAHGEPAPAARRWPRALLWVALLGLLAWAWRSGWFRAASPARRLLGEPAAATLPTTVPPPSPTTPAPPSPTPGPTATATVTPTITPTPTPTATPTWAPGAAWVRPTDGMVMHYIPAGAMRMGSTQGDADEQPVHEVRLSAFWMDRHEVTNEMYRLCVQARVCEQPGVVTFFDDPKYADYPVVYVSWYDAQTYCQWMGGRLPTEAEWEYAARGGLEQRLYPWGNEPPICTPGAANGAQFRACDGALAPVMRFAANGYGLYDMAGNVWEWVLDWYAVDYYAVSPRDNPLGPPQGLSRVLRGGSRLDLAPELRVANRSAQPPATKRGYIGFRCARPELP